MARDTSLMAYTSRVINGQLSGVDDQVFAFIYNNYNRSSDAAGQPMGVCPDQVRVALGIAQNTVSKSFSFLEHRDQVIYRVAIRPNVTTGLPVGWFAPRLNPAVASVPKNVHGKLYLVRSGYVSGPFLTGADRDAAISSTPAGWVEVRIKGNRIVLG